MPQSREETIQQALADYREGLFPSYRAAGAAYNVPHTTLSRRHKGTTTTRIVARESQMLLSPIQESLIRDWILYCETCGYAVSHAQLREFVLLLSTSIGGPSTLGIDWIPRFLRRHPDLKTKVGKRIDALRVDNVNEKDLRQWFDQLHCLITRLRLTPDNMYNCDETGIALGVCTNTRVIGTASTRYTRVKRPENREWVSIIECVSAAGIKLKPVVIYKAKTSLQSSWFPNMDNIPDFLYTYSTNGWTSNEISLQWLQ